MQFVVIVGIWLCGPWSRTATGEPSSVTTVAPLADAAATAASGCRQSQFACANGRCVPANKFCDAFNDCGDSSDEPRFCTPCNRTYYGEIGRTYELELHRPREDSLPYICHLTLAAGGGEYGDIVQVTLESFTLGRFVSFVSAGCPDGELEAWEWQRPRVGGAWCGASWGAPAVYYSETRAVTLAMRLLRLSKDNTGYNFDFKMSYKMLPRRDAVVRYGGQWIDVPDSPVHSSREPVMSLNVSSSSAAEEFSDRNSGVQKHVEELQQPQEHQEQHEHYLGELIANTYCSRIFSDCDRKDCRLESPNFPGIYPRNLTCYYAVRQHLIPPGKHALIVVRQVKGQMINIRSQDAIYTRTQQQQPNQARQLKVWSECDEVQDYVTVYDGYTTRDPVLLKFCGGGASVPEAVSSGPELLVEFSTSPYGTFLYPTPPLPLHGFQLQVQVRFVDQDSPKYARNKRCEFWLRGAGKGTLESPRHSLSANTTCLYHLQGAEPGTTPPPRHLEMLRRRPNLNLPPSRYRVWLAVLKYHVGATSEEQPCATRLQIWDGNVKAAPACNDIFCDKENSHGSLIYNGGGKPNLTLLARYCKDHVPRSCDHSLLANATRSPRPCSLAESFLSTGDSLTLELKITESTTLRPVSFRALYEFVDLHQDGEPYGTGPCSRRFVSRSQPQTAQGQSSTPLTFGSPRDVFLYGRGGATNLSCTYWFLAQKGERVRITLKRLNTGNRSDCVTRVNAHSERMQCAGNATATLQFWEAPWSSLPSLPRDCLCSSAESLLPYTFVSTSHVVEVKFNVLHMTSSDDFRNINFEASWEFVRKAVCTKKQKVRGISGEIQFVSPARTPDEVNCLGHPWVIIPSESRFLYVKLRGKLIHGSGVIEPNNTQVTSARCSTRNRVIIHSGNGVHVLICPMPDEDERHHLVEVFSEGWVIGGTDRVFPVWSKEGSESRSIMVEFIPRETGTYSVTWLELMRRPVVPSVLQQGLALSDCVHRCPELDACINSTLWCDGTQHCPSGYDEAIRHCFFLLQLPPSHLAAASVVFLLLSCVSFIVVRRAYRARRSGSRLKSLPSDTEAIVGTPKEVIC
ncbi:uncharacterized protein LOC111044919 [Nilaparvata lugens]|uniref:uncharacterized protein LOC111044919 n=1 Tax=Nilaparvata lugens TaxID=108931 RepID=UPI00193EB18E|nr:uncharacterized protein LOC111044919 [Nilaparvata lugens]